MQYRNPCVVIGNGPSLRGFDFHRLAGLPALGMNAAYRHWDQIGWYPTYYACLDDQVMKSHHAEIERLYADGLVKKLFLHHSFFDHHPHRLGHPDFTSFAQTSGYWYHQTAKDLGLERLYDRPAFKISDTSKITTGAHAVRYVAHQGHDQISLLGIDLRYVEILPEAEATSDIGLVIKATPKNNPNYFFDSYQQAGDLYNIPNPQIHNGNLHQRAFELISEDFEKNGVPCKVFNSNRESILSDCDIFPFLPIEHLTGESRLGSVFIPTNSRETNTLLQNFTLWSHTAYTPALKGLDPHKPKLVCVFNNETGRQRQDEISQHFQSTGMDRYFDGIFFEYLDLEGERDAYIRDYTKPVGDSGFKAGPNNQFFSSMRVMQKYGEYSFLMETDCLPIRHGWLTGLQSIIDTAEPFWVMGSAYRGGDQIGLDRLRHLNGNAIYATGDPDFQKFVTEFWEHHTWRLIREKDKRLAYDCILEIMFSENNIRDQAVMDVWKSTAHKFRYTDYMQNISGNMDINSADTSLISKLRRESPDTYVLHNRAVHKLILEDMAAGKLGGVSPASAGKRPQRLLVLDMTAIGNGTATGEIKASLLKDWPEDSLLQLARRDADNLSLVAPKEGKYTNTPLPLKDAIETIRGFGPDVILCRPLAETPELNKLALEASRDLNIPLITWIMDDWPARVEAESPSEWATIQHDFFSLIARSATLLSISGQMSAAFAKRYGRPFVPIANGIDPADWPALDKPERDTFIIRYAGGIAPDMNRDSLLEVAAAVDALSQAGLNVRLEISTQPWWLSQSQSQFSPFASTRLESTNRTPAEYRRWLSEADLLLICYNFDEKSLRYIRHSMANKMPECLASGVPVFAFGPEEAATIGYLAQGNLAHVVSTRDPRILQDALTFIMSEKSTMKSLAATARSHTFEHHNIHMIRDKFRRNITDATAKSAGPAAKVSATAACLSVRPNSTHASKSEVDPVFEAVYLSGALLTGKMSLTDLASGSAHESRLQGLKQSLGTSHPAMHHLLNVIRRLERTG
ncbi:MAG: hypothetical protein ACK4HF_17110 [Paracoccaceae bacterium]